jgi:uncharacterized Zn-finger protein
VGAREKFSLVLTNSMEKTMTDEETRQLFCLGEGIDLDRPRSFLEFKSYREVADEYFGIWGDWGMIQ